MTPHLYLRRRNVYMRDGIQDFFQKLKPYFNICIYTSVMRHNVMPVLDLIPSWSKLVARVFDRDYNKPDPNGKESWDTIRDMDRIFSSSSSKDNEFGLQNTILLDNETRKFQDAPENGILVGEYGLRQVQKKQKGSLGPLADYLLDLGKAFASDSSMDVRKYMAENPLNDEKFGSKTMASPSKEDDQAIESISDMLKGLKMWHGYHVSGAQVSGDRLGGASLETFDKVASDDEPPHMSLKSLLEKHSGETMRFDVFSDMQMVYTGFNHGIRFAFSIGPKINVTKAMSLQNLWEAIQEDMTAANPEISVNGESVELEESKST